MSKEENYTEVITNPLIELLAIKLFEHDTINGKNPKTLNMGWMTMCNEDRETFREIARGKETLGYIPED